MPSFSLPALFQQWWKDKRFLLWLGFGLLIRLLVMPWSMHSDQLSMSWRAYLMAGQGLWNLPTNQFLAHLIYAVNLLFLQRFGLYPTSWFQQPFGLYPGSKTASVGDWLVFVNYPQVNTILFGLNVPHLVVDVLIVFILCMVLRNVKHWKQAVLSWWLNPVVIYAGYIFGRHDIFTALTVLLAVVALSHKQIAASLLALYVGFQVRVQPAIYAPFFLVVLAFQKHPFKVWLKNTVILAGAILISLGLKNSLPFNPQLYQQLTRTLPGLPSINTQVVTENGLTKLAGLPSAIAVQLVNLSITTFLFVISYGFLLLVWRWLTQKKDTQLQQLEKSTAGVAVLTAAFFILVSTSPHYFIWLSLPVAVLIAFQPKLLRFYCFACLGWFIHSLFISDLTQFSQYLFLPVSVQLWYLPTLSQIIARLVGDPALVTLQVATRIAWNFSLFILIAKIFELSFPSLWHYFTVMHQKCLRHFLHRKHFPKFICSGLVLIGLFILFQASKITFFTTDQEMNTIKSFSNIQYETFAGWQRVDPGQALTGQVSVPLQKVGRLELQLSNWNDPSPEEFTFKIKQTGQKDWQYQQQYLLSNIYSGWYLPVGFPEMTVNGTPANPASITWEVSLSPQNHLSLQVNDVHVYNFDKRKLLGDILRDVGYKLQTQANFFGIYGLVVMMLAALLLWGRLKWQLPKAATH